MSMVGERVDVEIKPSEIVAGDELLIGRNKYAQVEHSWKWGYDSSAERIGVKLRGFFWAMHIGGHEIVTVRRRGEAGTEKPPPPKQVIDLCAALEASVTRERSDRRAARSADTGAENA